MARRVLIDASPPLTLGRRAPFEAANRSAFAPPTNTEGGECATRARRAGSETMCRSIVARHAPADEPSSATRARCDERERRPPTTIGGNGQTAESRPFRKCAAIDH